MIVKNKKELEAVFHFPMTAKLIVAETDVAAIEFN